ncbi:hypothetical protein ACEWY4_018653 [Coilia grayii]|uniref:Bucky ball n=1 Tax=Coilia grayii TaxID=363190 RepID=A0ABD1JDU0_9TELE
MYQWHGNGPYNHYGFQGSGLPLGRPYVSPYSYMQCPGYVMPHAPVHLLDYRRLCDPHFNPSAYDAVRRHHQPGVVSRETTCAGAQTDPSDALNKLIECLDKLRASDSTAEQELDSGVTSPASGICSPREEMRKEESEGNDQPEPTHIEVHQASSGVLLSSAAAVCEPSSRKSKKETWSMDSDGEPPMDSSSVHEESVLLEEEEHDDEDDLHFHHCRAEKQVSRSDYAQDPICHGETKRSSFEGFHSLLDPSQEPEDGMRRGTVETNQVDPQSGQKAVTKMPTGDDGNDLDLPYQIVRLPFGKVLSAGGLLKDVPGKAPCLSPPSLGNPFYYGYCAPQLAHERLSVLSPSLDELSSRDEMFSTDLEDIDLFPGHVYAGVRQPEMRTAVELQKPGLTTDGGGTCPRKYKCSECGLRVSKRAIKAGQECISETYCRDNDLADSDEGVIGEDEAESGFKSYSSSSRKKLPTCRAAFHKSTCLQQTKLKSRRLYCRGKTDQQVPPECHTLEYPMHKCCEEMAALAERTHRQESKDEQHRKCREKQWLERGGGLHQNCCEVGGGKGLVKARKVQPLPQRQAKRIQRRNVAKPSLYQKSELQNPEDNEEEEEGGERALP